MSIRPIDMQIMVQKTPDMAKPVVAESQHPQIQQQNLTEKLVKETLLNEERVIQTEHTENEEINPDGKGGAEYRREKNKRRRENREEAPEKDSALKSSMFDISI